MNNKPTRYREIEVSGGPRELGRQIGEAAKEEIRGFCEVALERLNRTVRVTTERASDVAQRSAVKAESYRSDLVEELRGTAEAAGVAFEQLMFLQVRNQFTPEKEGGCTSLGLEAVSGQAVVAQTWDNDPLLDEFTIVLTRRPTDRVATMTCTQAGLIAYMGFGDGGIGACVNTLPAPSREVGVPHYFTLRELLESTSLDQAVHAVSRAERAIPANIMIATPQGPVDLEVTVDQVRLLHPNNMGVIAHTNHCLHDELLEVNNEFPELIQSHERMQRMNALLAAPCDGAESIKAILSDHEAYPTSICRHPSDDPVDGLWVTVFALIVEPEQRQMHIARGTPCNRPFETYRIA